MYKCMLCGREMKSISWKHLHFKHGLTSAEYEAMGYETGIGAKLKGCSNLALKGRKFPGRTNSGQFPKGTEPWNKGKEMSPEYCRRVSEAMYAIPGAIRRGPDNTSWKGGVWKRFAEWRQAVLDRDSSTCRLCGEQPTGRRLHTHHIKFKRTHPKLEHDVSNGITLCSSCHMTVHQRPGFDLIAELGKLQDQS